MQQSCYLIYEAVASMWLTTTNIVCCYVAHGASTMSTCLTYRMIISSDWKQGQTLRSLNGRKITIPIWPAFWKNSWEVDVRQTIARGLATTCRRVARGRRERRHICSKSVTNMKTALTAWRSAKTVRYLSQVRLIKSRYLHSSITIINTGRTYKKELIKRHISL